MNEVKISGAFERGIELKMVDRGEKQLELATGSLTFTTKRGDQDVSMWIDVECVGPKAAELADVPTNVGVTITGEIRRAAWKDKVTDEWKHRHFIYYKDAELVEGYVAPVEDDIPF
jgi:hypothetical protein